MNNQKKVNINSGINKFIDIVYGRTYFHKVSNELKELIQTNKIQIDYNESNHKSYSPFYDCLYYPTVSKTKCGDQYNSEDWQKLESEIEKHLDKMLPTFEIYNIRRMTNELCYFLKIIFQSVLHPQEISSNFGFEYFVNQFLFIYNNFPNDNLKNDYKEFWITVLENLKTDSTVNRMGFDGQFRPIGNYVAPQLDWLKEQIEQGSL